MAPQDSSVFMPHSPQARAIARLFTLDLVIAGVVFATVATLVVYAAIRFRARAGDPEPRQDEGDHRLEWLWTLVPAGILAVLLTATVRTMRAVDPPAGGHAPDAVVIAHQWWWEYRYPRSGVRTANELHLPADETALLSVRSADVIHDFWVPDLGAKVDAVPGYTNHLWLTPAAGTYLGTCAEYCGAEHAHMGIRVIVEQPAAFAAWERSQRAIPAPPAGGPAAEGAKLFLERTCTNCHTVAGTAADGTVGPDLTHLADRQTLAAGVLDNTVDDLTSWIANPQAFKPGCHMPDLHLPAAEAHAIAVYLERP